MDALEIVKKYLESNNIPYTIDIVAGEQILRLFERKANLLNRHISVKELEPGTGSIFIYILIAKTCKKAKHAVCVKLNEINKKYDYAKAVYQESEQGELVLALYTLPAMGDGLDIIFDIVLKQLVQISEDIFMEIPACVLNGDLPLGQWMLNQQ